MSAHAPLTLELAVLAVLVGLGACAREMPLKEPRYEAPQVRSPLATSAPAPLSPVPSPPASLLEVATEPEMPFLGDVAQLSVGVAHVCAVTTRGLVVCWGDNSVGEVGVSKADPHSPDFEPRPRVVRGLPPIRQVSAGEMHTCALAVDGSVYCWGSWGRQSQATSGGMTASMVAHGADVGVPLRIGFQPGRPASGVELVHVSSAGQEVCAAVASTVACWQATHAASSPGLAMVGDYWRKTLPGVTSIAMSHGSVCAVAGAPGERRLFCWDDTWKAVPAPVDLGGGEPTQVVMGEIHACVLDAAGRASCWSSLIGDFWKRRPDRLLTWPNKARTRAIAVGESPVCTVDTVGTVDCFLSANGGLTPEALSRAWATAKLAPHPIAGVDLAVDVSLGAGRDGFGYGFGCALRKIPDPDGAQVFCWGDNELGQLGTGDESPSAVAKRVLGPSSRRVATLVR